MAATVRRRDLLLGTGLSLVGAACEPLSSTWPAREQATLRKRRAPLPAPPRNPQQLKVMVWNIKYCGGRLDFWFDLWGDRVHMTRAEAEGNLSRIVELINQVQPDVLIAEEIEVNSQRSAYVDAVREILERCSFSHAAYVSTWKSRYIPSEGLGRMDLGNAVFSRYPIVAAERIAQSDRTDQDALTRSFYLHRAVVRAVLDLGGRQAAVLGLHTEAYDTDKTKSRQLREILDLMNAEPLPFVTGGDFNALPPGSVENKGFNDEHPDSVGTEFEQPPYDLGDMVPFYDRFVPAIGLDRIGTTLETQRPHFTHSVIGRNRVGSRGEPGFWNRTLDYIFASPGSAWRDADTLQEPGRLGITLDPMELSDHCPVAGTWVLP
jgi:endonuclease/exonuclease/phosphatase family metal-dependent hydrolase